MDKSKTTTIPAVSIEPGKMSFYSKQLEPKQNKEQNENSQNNLKQAYTKKDISNTASKQLFKTTKALIHTTINYKEKTPNHLKKISYKPVFITLTLPASQEHSSSFITHYILRSFLKRLQYKFRSASYVWKAELQENGNIHYHLILDRFISWRWIRTNWNSVLENYNYITRFKNKYGHQDPNSTDVRGLKNKKKAAYYISKYIKKTDHKTQIKQEQLNQAQIQKFKEQPQENIANFLIYSYKNELPGRKWGCSTNYKNYKNINLDDTDFNVMQLFRKALQESTRHLEFDYVDVFLFQEDSKTSKIINKAFKQQRNHDAQYFKHNPPPN